MCVPSYYFGFMALQVGAKSAVRNDLGLPFFSVICSQSSELGCGLVSLN